MEELQMGNVKKYTVITGASSGIGYETAKAFANRGKNLIVAARAFDTSLFPKFHQSLITGLFFCQIFCFII